LLADGTGLGLAYVTAALLGQHPLPENAAKVIGDKLDLDAESVARLQIIPLRGSLGCLVDALVGNTRPLAVVAPTDHNPLAGYPPSCHEPAVGASFWTVIISHREMQN
jgi:hypothetical protein